MEICFLLLRLPGWLACFVFSSLSMTRLETVHKSVVGKNVFIFLFWASVLLLFSWGDPSDYLIGAGVVLDICLWSANGGISSKFRSSFGPLFVTIWSFPLNVLSFDNLLNTFVMLRLAVTKAFVVFWLGSLMVAVRFTLVATFGFMVGS